MKLLKQLLSMLFGSDISVSEPPHHHSNPDHQTDSSESSQVLEQITQTVIPDGPRGETIVNHITEWGREQVGIGDDTLIDWLILSARDEGPISYVEAAPIPNEVGYDKFIFVISFKKTVPRCIASYCFEDQKYLLFGQNADADVPLQDQLPW